MKHFTATKQVHVSADVAYGVASDVGSYKDFLPLLKRSTIRGARQKLGDGETFRAELVVAVERLGISESFVSTVVTNPVNRTVEAVSAEGPLHALTVKWSINDVSDRVCAVTIAMDYSFKNSMLQFAAGKVLELATPKIMRAFEDRALAAQSNS